VAQIEIFVKMLDSMLKEKGVKMWYPSDLSKIVVYMVFARVNIGRDTSWISKGLSRMLNRLRCNVEPEQNQMVSQGGMRERLTLCCA
jgi:hypothetical protein